MSINSNLVSVKLYISPILDQCTEVYKKTWSAENRVHYSSRVEQLFEAGVEKDFLMTIKPSFVRDFSAKEKLFIYEILRIMAVEDNRFQYLVEDLNQLLRKRGYHNERYFYLTHINDNQFAYEMDTRILGKEYRRTYYRKLNSKFGKKQLSLKEVFEQYFFTDFVELNRPRPKKKVRHKGYRDHGSLGSEFSKTLKQQGSDWSIIQKEKQKQKEKEDFLRFLSGFAGWE